MQNFLFLFISLIFFSLMFSHIYFTNQFFLRLKKTHPNTWKSLGEPKWMIHFGDDSFKNAMKFIRKQEFFDLNDENLEAISKKLKMVEKIALALALLIISGTIIDVVLQG